MEVAARTVNVTRLEHRAAPLPLPGAAAGAAHRPLLPVGDLAVLGAAGDGIAPRCLYELLRAGLAARGREDHDLALPAHLAAPACLVAAVPVRPIGDLAVHLADVQARLRLLEVTVTRRSSAQGVGADLALAVALPGGAAAPCGPGAVGAVLHLHLAGLAVARPHLVEAFLAGLAAMLRVLDNLPLAVLEATVARLLALRPLGPCGERAVLRGDGIAVHGLVQGSLARPAIERRYLDDGTLPVPLSDLPVHLAG
mmetsp:Transcript_95501/g.294626  ORF Transcript_95501/g.294626 Transcript_95501/m.294626 type:complete len:254 (-) Transcript_95501:2540-3301(-)